jgi:membrane-associated phospholipid phosphatase
MPAQQSLLDALLFSLSGSDREVHASETSRSALRSWLAYLPVTGRVRVALSDARWLQANPNRDPILRADHMVILPQRPSTVTVVTSSGEKCHIEHAPLVEARSYVGACSGNSATDVDWVWIAQPDGRVQRFGIGLWNEQSQAAPAPGAWIWAPARNAGWSESFSERLTAFLATQGPSEGGGRESSASGNRNLSEESARSVTEQRRPEYQHQVGNAPVIQGGASANGQPGVGRARMPEIPEGGLATRRSRSYEAISGDWGGVGLLQTPTARMADEGNISSSLSRVAPYTNYNFIVTPLPWLEAGFRYTSVSDVAYSQGLSQAYKDKAFDAKFRLVEERVYVPQVSLGFRDIAGTGLFSSEYVVANKRTGPFDWSLGMGWGYLGSRGRVRNPLTLLSPRFGSRTGVVGGQGGTLSLGGYFRGPSSIFGGVQYQTPWDSLLLKIEYDGHDYQQEPLNNNIPQRSSWNVGLVYRPHRALDVMLGFERGNTAMLTLIWHGNLSELGMPKFLDPPPIPLSPSRSPQAPDWAKTARDISTQTNWRVEEIKSASRDVRVTIDDPLAAYWKDRIDRAAAVLHRDAPENIDRFVLRYKDRGIDLAEQIVDRDSWLAQRTLALPPGDVREPVIAQGPRPDLGLTSGRVEYRGAPDRFETGFGFAYQQTLGGPDGFVLYQAGVEQKATFRIRADTWIQGYLHLGLIDNYEKFKVTGPSELPRVRTFLREFLTTSKFTMPSLLVAHVGRLTENQYYSAYGGYLESMFAGVGGEWFYRPFQSRVAIGIDANIVQQRDFKQDFALRDYRTTTGHATLYWDTGWNGVQITMSAGRYLAKDIGATLDFSRSFSNGARVGAFFTRTNVSAEQFGEGSFDKGVYFSIPFDTMLPKTTNSYANVLWRPLTRDGGAKLDRAVRLIDVTGVLDMRTLQRQAAPPLNETLPASDQRDKWQPIYSGPQPDTSVAPRPFTAQLKGVDSDRYEFDIIEALYRQGFRDVSMSYDASRRLVLSLMSTMQPQSRAVGRAARTALRLAPLDVREIRIFLTENGRTAARYELVDLPLLSRFFDGNVGLSEIRGTVAVEYFNASARQDDPLALFGDLGTEAPTPRQLKDIVLPSSGTAYRVLDDFKVAGHLAVNADWLRSGLVGAGLILGAGLADNRVDRFAVNQANNSLLKRVNTFGNALPWLAIGGAVAAAMSNGDPRLSRTGYAATESGATAFAAVTGLKYVFGRARPENGLGSRSFKPFTSASGSDSFPSGHTIISWAIATPFAEEYDAPWLYGVAAVTNLARVGSRQHWLSDTVAGSAIGYAIGKVFFEAGRDPSRKGPRVVVGPRSLALSWATD